MYYSIDAFIREKDTGHQVRDAVVRCLSANMDRPLALDALASDLQERLDGFLDDGSNIRRDVQETIREGLEEYFTAPRRQMPETYGHPDYGDAIIRILPGGGVAVRNFEAVSPSFLGNDIGRGMAAVRVADAGCSAIAQKAEVLEELAVSGADEEMRRIAAHFVYELRCYRDLEVPVIRIVDEAAHFAEKNHAVWICRDEQMRCWLVMQSGPGMLGSHVSDIYKKKEADCGGVGKFLEDYLYDAEIMEILARDRRMRFLSAVRSVMGIDFEDLTESCYCQIDQSNPLMPVLRKGAVPARENDRSIVCLGDRAGWAVAAGKGSLDWNFSAPYSITPGTKEQLGEFQETIEVQDWLEPVHRLKI